MLAVTLEALAGEGGGLAVELVEIGVEVALEGPGQAIVKGGLRQEDAAFPAGAGLRVRGELELQELLDDGADLAAASVALLLAQIRDVLGEAFSVDGVVAALGGEQAQRLRLNLGPGVEVVFV